MLKRARREIHLSEIQLLYWKWTFRTLTASLFGRADLAVPVPEEPSCIQTGLLGVCECGESRSLSLLFTSVGFYGDHVLTNVENWIFPVNSKTPDWQN